MRVEHIQNAVKIWVCSVIIIVAAAVIHIFGVALLVYASGSGRSINRASMIQCVMRRPVCSARMSPAGKHLLFIAFEGCSD